MIDGPDVNSIFELLVNQPPERQVRAAFLNNVVNCPANPHPRFFPPPDLLFFIPSVLRIHEMGARLHVLVNFLLNLREWARHFRAAFVLLEDAWPTAAVACQLASLLVAASAPNYIRGISHPAHATELRNRTSAAVRRSPCWRQLSCRGPRRLLHFPSIYKLCQCRCV